MATRIAIIQGHPDGTSRHLHAMADAYATAQGSAGHELKAYRGRSA